VRPAGLRAVAFGSVLLFSLSVWVTQWDRLLLSESLGVSLTVAVLAAWLALVRAPSRWTIAALLGTTLAWTAVRDSNAFLAGLVLVLAVIWALVARRRLAVVVVAGLALVSIASVLSQSGPDAYLRRQLPLQNIVGMRVLTDQGELRWFREHGMPLPASLRGLGGTQLGARYLHPEDPLYRDPEVQAFRRWLREHGGTTLATYLLTHPGRLLGPVAENRDELFGTVHLVPYRSRGTHPVLPAALAAVVYPASAVALVAWLAVLALVAAWLARGGWARPVWLVPIAVVVLQVGHAAIVFHGDSLEVARHALPVGILTRLGLLVLTLFLIDAALARRAGRQ
jgi:hypothetical protein